MENIMNDCEMTQEEVLERYQKAADEGSTEAQYKLGKYYLDRDISLYEKYLEHMLPKDEKNHWPGYFGLTDDVYEYAREAEKWLRKAAEQGNIEAQYRLGDIYDDKFWFLELLEEGLEDLESEKKKYEWNDLEKSKAETLKRNFQFHDSQECKIKVKEYAEEAIKWYRKAADQGSAEAQVALGNFYRDKNCSYYNEEEAIKWFRKAAEQGDAEMQHWLGEYYFGEYLEKQDMESMFLNVWGGLLPEDSNGYVEKAEKWYLKAAEQGHIEAQMSLGDLYKKKASSVSILGMMLEDSEVEREKNRRETMESLKQEFQCQNSQECEAKEEEYIKEAEKWFRKAAEQGHTEALCRLGKHYYEYGFYEKAIKWFKEAAEQGYADVEALEMLADCYEECEDVEKDFEEVEKWYQKAADEGSVEAQKALGDFYRNKNYAYYNEEETIKWYRKAADQGSAEAQVALGNFYRDKNCSYYNEEEAIKWFRKAAEQGYAEAQYNLENIYHEKCIGYDEEAVNLYRKMLEAAERTIEKLIKNAERIKP